MFLADIAAIIESDKQSIEDLGRSVAKYDGTWLFATEQINFVKRLTQEMLIITEVQKNDQNAEKLCFTFQFNAKYLNRFGTKMRNVFTQKLTTIFNREKHNLKNDGNSPCPTMKSVQTVWSSQFLIEKNCIVRNRNYKAKLIRFRHCILFTAHGLMFLAGLPGSSSRNFPFHSKFRPDSELVPGFFWFRVPIPFSFPSSEFRF